MSQEILAGFGILFLILLFIALVIGIVALIICVLDNKSEIAYMNKMREVQGKFTDNLCSRVSVLEITTVKKENKK